MRIDPLDEESKFTTFAAMGLMLEMALSRKALTQEIPSNLYTDVALVDMALGIVRLRKVS